MIAAVLEHSVERHIEDYVKQLEKSTVDSPARSSKAFAAVEVVKVVPSPASAFISAPDRRSSQAASPAAASSTSASSSAVKAEIKVSQIPSVAVHVAAPPSSTVVSEPLAVSSKCVETASAVNHPATPLVTSTTDGDLPFGWLALQDDEGDTYYHNEVSVNCFAFPCTRTSSCCRPFPSQTTGEISWVKPGGAAAGGIADDEVLPEGWTRVVDEEAESTVSL